MSDDETTFDQERWVLMRKDGSFLQVNGWAIRIFDSFDEAMQRMAKANVYCPNNPWSVVPYIFARIAGGQP